MDALLRLRVLIWLVVLTLWGVMVYDFLGEEDKQDQARMQPVTNPYPNRALPAPEADANAPTPAQIEAEARKLAESLPPAQQPPEQEPSLESAPPPAIPPEEVSAAPGGPTENRPSSLDFIKPFIPETAPLPAPSKLRRGRRETRRLRADRQIKVPPGFVKNVSAHFIVYSEGMPASDEFMTLIENLHGNLMLDLAAFSPWASDQKVTVFLCQNQDTYRELTGRPAWSGGASSVARRLLYVYESDELPGIVAHELCHIYYDGFYLEGKLDPLWLSEGMATLIQVERGMSSPEWLKDDMRILERGGGYSVEDLMSVTSLEGASDERVRLWYAQSYSLVRFLIRSQYRSSFYKFSEFIREGKDPTQALYRAYGMPFNRIKALEYAWRGDLANSSLSKLTRSEN